MVTMKKLFAVMASIMMLATTLPVAVLGQASYSTELEGAYAYANGVGITTQTSIDAARMYDNMTRAEMAKMVSTFATQVVGSTADTTLACSFSDLAPVAGTDLAAYAKTACQLGLMGVGTNGIFNPNGIVTRAEFGTVLSRSLWGSTYNATDGDVWYAAHLTALKAAGIMNDISSPTMKEVRGYVMLMMQRSDESGAVNGDTAMCNTPEVLFACLLDIDCPAACQADTTPTTGDDTSTDVKMGGLTVALNTTLSLANGTQVPATGTIRFAVVNFTASSSNDVSLKTVELKKVGLASIPSSTRVWFEKNGKRVSGKAAFSSDGTAIISFAPVYVVKAGSTESLDLYVELGTSAGQDFQFASAEISSTAEFQNGSFTTPILRTASYTVAPIAVESASSTGSTSVSDNGMELGAFKVTNNDTASETRDVSFKSITLRQNGNGSLSSLADVVLERNGVIVATNPTIAGKDVIFSLADTIKDGTSATYYLKAIVNNVENSAGDTYQFSVRNTSDVNAVEQTTAFRSTVSFSPSATALQLYTYTVTGGDMTLSRDTSVALASNYAAGSDNVVLMKGTITAKFPMTVEDVTLSFTTGGAVANLSQMFTTIYMTIGSSTFSYSPTVGDTAATFLGTALINGSATVKIYGKLKDTAPAGTVYFEDLNLNDFTNKEYVSNGNTVTSAVGAIAGVHVTSQTATLNVTRTDGLGNTNIAKGASSLLVYQAKLSSSQGNGVTVSNIVFAITGYANATSGYLNNASLTLYVDGVAKKTKTVDSATSVTFDGFSIPVTPSASATIAVKANFSEAFSVGSFKLTLSTMNAVDKLTSAAVTYNTPAGATFTIGTAAGTIAESNSNPQAQLLLSTATNQKLLGFKVTATNDNISLYDVALTGTDLDKFTNFRLQDSSGTDVASATTATSTGITFSAISSAPTILMDKTANYFVVADVNSITTGAVTLHLDAASSNLTNIKASNGTIIDAGGSNVNAAAHVIAENTMTVAKATNSSKSLTTSALRFNVTAYGKNQVTLSGIDFTILLAGYTTGSAQISVYQTTTATTNLAGQTAAGISTGGQYVALTAKNTVDAGDTVTYIAVVEGTLVNSTATSTDWSLSMTDIDFNGGWGILTAVTYPNIGLLPMTETK